MQSAGRGLLVDHFVVAVLLPFRDERGFAATCDTVDFVDVVLGLPLERRVRTGKRVLELLGGVLVVVTTVVPAEDLLVDVDRAFDRNCPRGFDDFSLGGVAVVGLEIRRFGMRGDFQISIQVEVGDRLFLRLGEILGVLLLLLLGEVVDIVEESDDFVLSTAIF